MNGEFPLQGVRGKLVCRDDGMRCSLCAECPDDGRGLYKVFLHGEQGRMLLGTLVPENGALRLRRSMSIAELKRKGCWPIQGGEAELAFSFTADRHEPALDGWERAEHAEELLPDDILRSSASRVRGLLVRRERSGFLLAAPYGERNPFPLTPLFCLGVPRQLGQRRYIIFQFDRSGTPELPHETPSGVGH